MDDLPGWTPRPGASVTWCGSHAEVIAAYPHLAYPGLEPEPFWCFDLIVEIDGDGRLVNPALEHWDLETAFEAMGRTQDASAAAALPGSPAEAAVPELAALLTRLFTSPDPPPAWT